MIGQCIRGWYFLNKLFRVYGILIIYYDLLFSRSQISYTSNGHHLTSYASIVERGLEPESIIGTIKGDDDKPIFLIAWKNSPDGVIDFMESKVVNEKWPQLVIQFYQTRLTYQVQIPKIKTENNVGYYDEDEDEYNESNFNENPTI